VPEFDTCKPLPAELANAMDELTGALTVVALICDAAVRVPTATLLVLVNASC
jgi:hypothetical protein